MATYMLWENDMLKYFGQDQSEVTRGVPAANAQAAAKFDVACVSVNRELRSIAVTYCAAAVRPSGRSIDPGDSQVLAVTIPARLPQSLEGYLESKGFPDNRIDRLVDAVRAEACALPQEPRAHKDNHSVL